MSETIVISSNCQTGGIAATMRAIYPGKVIVPIRASAANDKKGSNALIAELANAAIWITGGRFELAQNLPVKVIKVPSINFHAFHPDLCYAEKKSANTLTKVHYNSQIAIWAFNNQIDTSDAVRLFNGSTFKALGYFDQWGANAERLKLSFRQNDFSDIEFNQFFLAVKRRGVFMHSVNHPSAETIVEFCKLIAIRLGADQGIVKRKIIIPDSLIGTIWPLYPEIGQELGLVGNYVWRIGNQEIEGLESYLDFAYQQYLEQGIQPSDLVSKWPIPHLDSVLNTELKKR
ncbi:MAG: WcbI family polysaccharide biosynthesis putative acetyltransferase [Methylovulum sp.]|uniref:WcbI family polysaccharide biosynthesis putative acetyltransferase n=1 Tax=Methylovulum sp. TaxID=1916980 RepID=UPI00262A6B82|nr:WcbI family polysaccharide biosynthesis putative acetyltransferase [Methylovulum sp.]MDD2722834.1 WcbI family polysaccharide biosynthesis putative acetyltransferase [Methylovulum sp.]MDD5124404.1 WcbI family polysaccharide biosynthesis putative acetyltransferase [Methylovulum sp.]